jgi:hypothetical protein
MTNLRDDWRLTNQEAYLKAATLTHRTYQPAPGNDHDHCEFCWTTFSLDARVTDRLTLGYTTADDRWICEPCFRDFASMFQWIVIE